MKSYVFSAESVGRIEAHLESAQRAGVNPTLAIVFSAARHDPVELGAVFANRGIELFGASSSGEFTQDEVTEGAIAVMLLDIDRDLFRVNMFDGSGKHALQIGRQVADWATGIFEHPAFMLLTAGLQANGEDLVREIDARLQKPVPLYGGIAGIESGSKETFVFSNAGVIENGAITLAFDGSAVALHGIAASGWKGVGTLKTITRAEGSIVYKIDGEPALDMYNKYLNIGDDPTLAYEYPLLLMRNDGSYLLRGSIRLNEDKSITYGGSIPEGIKVRFSMPPGLEIIDHAIEKVSSLTQLLPAADAVVLFSCQGRRIALGPLVANEIEAIHDLWKVPLVGFFTNGEIGPMPNGRCELHNHTLVPVVIRQL